MMIGNVKIHLDFYDDQYQYSDGQIEETLLEIVKSTKDYEAILKQSAQWPLLYHLHPDRENVLGCFEFGGSETVLEVGSGCGALTGLLARKCAHVFCNDISLRRSEINAYKNSDYDNIDIYVANFMDLRLEQTFDIITLIGVLEYACSYVGGEDPYMDMLRMLEKKLLPGGKLIIAIENKFGLKYWAGCREDHTSLFFEGLEGYTRSAGVETFSRNRMESMLKSAGFNNLKFYYPIPDYKFAHMIYSDERLPKAGELRNLQHNFDATRMELFDEGKVYDQIIKENAFPFFANSFLIEAGRG